MSAPTPAAWPLLALVPLVPLAGATVLGLGGATIQKRFGKGAVGAIACGTVGVSFLVAVAGFLKLLGMAPESRLLGAHLFRWIDVGTLQVDAAFMLDPLSAVMILVVTGIGGLIHVYATGYMHDDEAFWRFFAYLNLFTFAMLTLVLGDSLLLMFVGWEGVGFCSWGLIGFWHKEVANSRAGNKAFIVNRVGDFGFVLGMLLLFWSLDARGHGTLEFPERRAHAHLLEGGTFWGWPIATLVTLFLFVGATGKSAQIPLHVWLPDAMAGPTPGSALGLAATMVTAGVYMIARLNFLYAMAPATLALVAVIGAATALLAATIALAQNDIKRVLAYSTVSQLGYMFLAMGVGAFSAGILHLMTHAFFKACLFLGSGSVIHAMNGEQDMRKMGGLWSKLPHTSKTFLIATLAIAGFPPLAGFFSKDEILLQVYLARPALWAVGLTVAGMTAFYMFRQFFMTFTGACRADHHTQEHLHESPPSMTIPLWILAAGATFAGLLWWPRASLFEAWLAPAMGGHGHATHHAAHPPWSLELGLMGISVAVASTGLLVAWAMYYRRAIRPETFSEAMGGVPYRLVLNKWYVDEIYELVFVRGLLVLCGAAAWFDARVIDGIVNASATVTRLVAWSVGLFDQYVVDGAVDGVATVTQFTGRRFRNFQSGAITWYVYVILLGVIGSLLLYRSLAVAS